MSFLIRPLERKWSNTLKHEILIHFINSRSRNTSISTLHFTLRDRRLFTFSKYHPERFSPASALRFLAGYQNLHDFEIS